MTIDDMDVVHLRENLAAIRADCEMVVEQEAVVVDRRVTHLAARVPGPIKGVF